MPQKEEIERGDSMKGDFDQHLKDTAAAMAEKGLKAEGADATDAVNTDALAKLMDGGGLPLERLNIAINWAQNFGLVMLVDVAWPESFKEWFTWIEMLGLDFDVFGGMGEDVSISLGLLVPVWLVWEFDVGLFQKRTYFAHYYFIREGEEVFIMGCVLSITAIVLSCMNISNSKGWVTVYKDWVPVYIGAGFFLGLCGWLFLLPSPNRDRKAGLMPIAAIVISMIIAAAGWSDNDLVNAFILVLSGLSLLSFLHQSYLVLDYEVCESAGEDFAKKRQENQMYYFLFFYIVAYLSGVSACTKLMVAKPEITNTDFYCENSTFAAEQMEPEQRKLLVEPFNTIVKYSSEDAWDGGVFGLADNSSGIKGETEDWATAGAELWGAGWSGGQGQRRMTGCGLGSGLNSTLGALPTGQLQDASSVRIRNSSNNSPTFDGEGVVSGRIEVKPSGETAWGTIYDDPNPLFLALYSWDDVDALVACREIGSEIGYTTISGTALSRGNTTDGSGEQWWKFVGCSGSEETLESCPKSTLFLTDHSNDIGITCKFVQTECEACPAGKFSDTIYTSPCTSCEAGRYSSTPSATSSETCVACEAGKASSSTGSVACTSCEAGTISTDEASTICTKCASGKYSNLAISSTSCAANCTAGRYATGNGLIDDKAVYEKEVKNTIGSILLPFYVILPLLVLTRAAQQANAAVKVEATNGRTYKDSIDVFRKKAVESRINEVTAKENMEKQRLSRDSPGYRASVAAVLIAPYEEKFWWWKIFLMFEKALLAIIVLVGASSWVAVAVAGCGWLASAKCRPHWDQAEDGIDILARLTTFLTCLVAALIEEGVLKGDEVWVAITLNSLAAMTLLTLVYVIRPSRLVRGAFKSTKSALRGAAVRAGEVGIANLTKASAAEITETEFEQFSPAIKGILLLNFPELFDYFNMDRPERILFALQHDEAAASFISESEAAEILKEEFEQFPEVTQAKLLEKFCDTFEYVSRLERTLILFRINGMRQISKTSESDAKEIPKEEFEKLSDSVKGILVGRFGRLWGDFKFGNESLILAVGLYFGQIPEEVVCLGAPFSMKGGTAQGRMEVGTKLMLEEEEVMISQSLGNDPGQGYEVVWIADGKVHSRIITSETADKGAFARSCADDYIVDKTKKSHFRDWEWKSTH
ncbi:hypothetical protein TrRE_jg11604, partial [Triparma retinervis]